MGKNIEITAIRVGAIETNCYVVNKVQQKECVVIDPGYDADKIKNYLDGKGMKIVGILLTHAHFDHITEAPALASMSNAKMYALEDELDLFKDANLNCSSMMPKAVAFEPECLVKDGQIISLAGIDFKVLHTPGHSKGSCCFYIEEEKTLFGGDTVFMESVGRSDLPTGNGMKLVESIKNVIFTLPDDVDIYPGHGPSTDVGYEKNNNPYV